MKARYFLGIDYLLLLSAVALLIVGIIFIYSAGVSHDGVLISGEYRRQIVWAGIGTVLAVMIAMVNYRRLYNFSFYIYIATIVLLLYTIIFGVGAGAARWIRIGGFGIQVSEFAKIAVIIMLARYLVDTKRDNKSFIRFFVCCCITFLPMLLVLAQPDLGTALVFIPILLIMIFTAGIAMRYVIFMISGIILTSLFLMLPLWQIHIYGRALPWMALLTDLGYILIAALFLGIIAAIALFSYLKFKKRYFFWIACGIAIIILSLGVSYAARMTMRHYQLMRLIVFIDPNVDPRGAGWNIIQSITAIGAGGLTGQGFLQGTQGHFRFLPEQSTDFIFSIFSEEAGFLGGIFVFSLYLVIFLRILRTMKITVDPFACYICAGLVGMFSFHFIINVGMTMGIMPITGIPLLFMSYGGSAVFAAMIGIGLVLGIHLRRYDLT